MKLSRLRLENFRQFYGASPSIVFSTGNKNITVFHGENGAGKTALLNAFTWLLHDTTTNGFLLPEQIVNIRAIREAKVGETVSAFVELDFEHDNIKYRLKRVHEVERTNEGKQWESKGSSTAELSFSEPDGKWKPEKNVVDAIGRVLPKVLHSYFFFDGERIEKIVQPTKKEQKEIGNATKMLLGVEVFDRAIHHLKGATKKLENELRDIGDTETRRLLDQKNEQEDNIQKWNDRELELTENIVAEEKRKKEIDQRLGKLADAKVIQKRREELTTSLATRETEYDDGKKLLEKSISHNAYSVFLDQPIKKFQSLIKELHDRGELPSGIKRNFVEALLKDDTCICTQSLESGSKFRAAVEQWMKKAGLIDVEERALIMDGEVKQISFSIDKTLEDFDAKQRQLLAIREERSRIEVELEDIHKKLEKSPKEEISKLEAVREKIKENIKGFIIEGGGINEKKNEADKKIIDLALAIEKHLVIEDKQTLLKRQINASRDAMERIARVRECLEEGFRIKLLVKIKSLFREISPTPYIPDLSSDYSLRLLNSSGGVAVPVAASEGESQILSLSFIGSIIDVTRERHKKDKGELYAPASSSYPLVMDSPFGKLGSGYRRQIATHMPKLADQVIVMVTETQWRNEVEKAMSDRIGRSYVLTYYTPRTDIDAESVDIDGQTYDLIKSSPNEYEYTEIREVTHG